MTDAAPQGKVKFYTTGFSGREVGDLKPLLDALDAVLVDVRFFPQSDSLRWRQVYLKALLREKYRHVAILGSRADRAGKNHVQHLDLGVKILISFEANAVLMCECAAPEDCHRLVIAKELRRRGFEVKELDDWKLAPVI